MSRHDATISECNLGEDAVAYLYGELPDTNRVIFESHLVACASCTDEFATMASARYEVYDWKKIEFDPLATPHFEIPFEHSNAVTESWGDRIRSVFGRGWAIPGLGFAGLAAVLIFATTLLFTSGGPDEIASSTPAVENPSVIAPADSPADRPQIAPSVTGDGVNVQPSEEVGRVRATPVIRSNRRGPVRNVSSSPSKRVVKPDATRAVKVDVPRLNGFPDDEDTSLRLAELFEDGDTRD